MDESKSWFGNLLAWWDDFAPTWLRLLFHGCALSIVMGATVGLLSLLGLATVLAELYEWGPKFLAHIILGLIGTWMAFAAYWTLLDKFTNRRQVTERIDKVLRDPNREDDGQYVLAGALNGLGSAVLMGLVLGCSLLMAYI